MFRANSTNNTFRKKIKLKNNILTPHFSKTSYSDFTNKNNENNINDKNKGNLIKK